MSSIGAYATARRGGVSMAEIDAVRGKLGSRATVAQIAKMIGRCEADVRAVLSPEASPVASAPRGASSSFKWTDSNKRLAGLMREAGATSDEIGRAVGCSGGAVRVFFQREATPASSHAKMKSLGTRDMERAARRELFTRLWTQGVPRDEIAERMGMASAKDVGQMRQRLGLPARARVSGSPAYAVPTEGAA